MFGRHHVWVFALLFVSGCQQPHSTVPTVGTSEQVAVVVQRQDFQVWKEAGGVVVAPADRIGTVQSTWSGTITRVLVSLGQNVRQGDVVMALSNPQADAAYQQAGVNLDEARAALKSAQASAESGLAGPRLRLDQARTQEKQARLAVQADQRPATRSVAMATPAEPATPSDEGFDNPNVQVLGEHTTPPQVRVQRGIAHPERLASDQLALQSATEARQQAELGVTQGERQVQQSLAPQRAAVEEAQAALKTADHARRLAEVRAPIAGEVVQLSAMPNQQASPGAALATIVDLSALRLQSDLAPADASTLKPGTPVRVSIKALPGQTFAGRVDHLLASPQSRPMWEADVRFDNPQGEIKPGLQGGFRWLVADLPNALVIPIGALRPGNTVVVNRHGWQTVTVTPGMSNGTGVEIRSGLGEGEQVQMP
ncbi:MAG TPA: efflux RND transporter periplasmic adaptor subunit [Candidatus Xenobia bacterium]|jgi:HlyD family secretion protein